MVSALTTTFVPPSSCLSETYAYLWTSDKIPPGWNYELLGPRDASDCTPDGHSDGHSSFFSPGICPSGYAVGCTSKISIASVTETVATCCPIAYTCRVPVADWASIYPCEFAPQTERPITKTEQDGTVITETYIPQGVNAQGVIIRNQESVSSPGTISGTTTVTASPVSSTSIPSPASSISIPSPSGTLSQDGTQSLTSGARIGIGVGAAIGVLFVLTTICLIVILRKRKRRDRDIGKPLHDGQEPPGIQELYYEMGGTEASTAVELEDSGSRSPLELYSRQVFELEGDLIMATVRAYTVPQVASIE